VLLQQGVILENNYTLQDPHSSLSSPIRQTVASYSQFLIGKDFSLMLIFVNYENKYDSKSFDLFRKL